MTDADLTLDKEGIEIWRRALEFASLPEDSARVPLQLFCESFCKGIAGSTSIDVKCVRTVLADKGEHEDLNPMVTIRSLALLLVRFGKYERCPGKIRDVLMEGRVWFHGAQSRSTSEELLAEKKTAGAFLLRYSRLPGFFTVDYVTKDGKLRHFNNVRNDADGGVLVTVSKSSDKQTLKYSSVSAFVSKNRHMFSVPVGNKHSHFQAMKLAIPSEAALKDVRGSQQSEVRRVTVGHGSGPHTLSDDEKALLDKRVAEAIGEMKKDTRALPRLDLRGLGLVTPLPSQIFGLRQVQELDLSSNNILEIPVALGGLVRLQALNLSDNCLTALPGALFRQLQNLTRFQCSENQLTRIPDELFEIEGLTHLDLSCNQIRAVQGELGRLQSLQFLDLSTNAIGELPDVFDQLGQLEELYVKCNKLLRLPPTIAAATTLFFLDVSSNGIDRIPDEFWGLLDSNPRFVFLAASNPVSKEVLERRKAKLASGEQARRQAMPHRSVDIFQLLGIQQGDKDLSPSMVDAALRKAAEGGDQGPPRPGRPTISAAVRASMQVSAGASSAGVSAAAAAAAAAATSGGSAKRDAGGKGGEAETSSLWVREHGYVLEEPQGERPRVEDLKIREHINLSDYSNFFYQRTVHANIIGNDGNHGDVVLSIQKELLESDSGVPSDSYRVLYRTKEMDHRFEVASELVKMRKKERYARSEDLLAALKRQLKGTAFEFSPKNLYVVRDSQSHKAFLKLESKLMSSAYKFGIMYGTEGQGELEMYKNREGSARYEAFLSLIGNRINIKGWDKYRGGLSNKDDWDSLYTVYQDHEIMYHVSTLLPYMEKTDEYGQQWERKRFIGNDIVVIVFYEGTSPLTPAFESNFNHVFAMVQPVEVQGRVKYKLHMCYKRGVADSLPHIPEGMLFEHDEYFREFLLCKLCNAEHCAMSAPQFRRPQERVRAELFSDLQKQFPRKKERVSRASRPEDQTAVCYLDVDSSKLLSKQLKQ